MMKEMEDFFDFSPKLFSPISDSTSSNFSSKTMVVQMLRVEDFRTCYKRGKTDDNDEKR